MAPANSALLQDLLLGTPSSESPQDPPHPPLNPSHPEWGSRVGAAELQQYLVRIREREVDIQRRMEVLVHQHSHSLIDLTSQAYSAALESQGLNRSFQEVSRTVLGSAVHETIQNSNSNSNSRSSTEAKASSLRSSDVEVHEGGPRGPSSLAEWNHRIIELAGQAKDLASQSEAQRKVVQAVRCAVQVHEALQESEALEASGQFLEAAKLVGSLREALQRGNSADVDKEAQGSILARHVSQLAGDWTRKLLKRVEGALSQLCRVDQSQGEVVLSCTVASEPQDSSTVAGKEPGSIQLRPTMDALTFLFSGPGPAWARVAEPLLSFIIIPFLREPTRELLISSSPHSLTLKILSKGPPPPAPAESSITEHLYPKLLQILVSLKGLLDPLYDPPSPSHVPEGTPHPQGTQGFPVLWRLMWPRIADVIISQHLSKALPMETHQLTAFRVLQQRTEEFETSLREQGILPRGTPAPSGTASHEEGAEGAKETKLVQGGLLMQFAADVDLHFAARKRVRLLSHVRAILTSSSDFFSTLVKMEPSASALQFRGLSLPPPSIPKTGASGSLGSDPLSSHVSVLHWEPCHVTDAAQRVMSLVRETMQEACECTERTAPELYGAARDAITLFRALTSSQGRGVAWRGVPQLSMLVHNDLLFLGHTLLTLAYQMKSILPPHLQGVVMFTDMVPFLWEEATLVSENLLQKQTAQLFEALDGAHGFAHTDKEVGYSAGMRALKQVHHQLSQLASVVRPVMAPSQCNQFLCHLLDSALERIILDILSLKDISVDETLHLRKLLLGFLERVPSAVQQGSAEEVPMPLSFRKLQRLADILDMSLRAITQAWRTGDLSSCGFTAQEVYHAITAIFSDTPLRRDCLGQILLPL